MSYIGNVPTTAAFPFDQFSGNASTTAFTLTYAPAGTTSILVSVSGVTQNPNTYGVIGTTLTFTGAPPTGTNNVAVLYLGLPVIGTSSPGNTAYRTPQDFTATASQTTFTTAGSYTVGFVDVYRNGARLGTADFTATNGTTVVLANACTAGDLVTIVYFTLTSIVNAVPQSGGTITGNLLVNGTTTMNGAIGSGYTGFKNRIINGDMRIDQRNAGASVTNPNGYVPDRWVAVVTGTAQRVADAPSGFVTSLSLNGSSGFPQCAQRIESANADDLVGSFVTVSFWAKRVSGATELRVQLLYPNALDTWSSSTIIQETVYTAPAIGAWIKYTITSNAVMPTNVANGLGVLIYSPSGASETRITGVQLERGSNATSFEFIDYGRQLIQCQRYYELITASARAYTSDGAWGVQYVFKTTMRANPTYTDIGGGVNSLPATNQGVISGSTQEAGIQWSGAAGTYYVYARAASFNAEL